MLKDKIFPSKIRNKTRMPTFITYIKHCTGVLAKAISQEKETKAIQVRKEKVKLSLFTNDIVLYIENPKESTNKTIKS